MSESGTHALSVLKISLSGNSGYSQRNCDDFSTISLVHNSKRYSALFIYLFIFFFWVNYFVMFGIYS